MNTYGRLLRLTTWGESHGSAIGGVLDGFPPRFKVDLEELQREVLRRAPGHHHLSTPRKETDEVQILSGLVDGYTTGAPISYLIANSNVRSKDYDELASLFRPGHADYTYQMKYGIREHRGGGRSSARETASRVVAGALAKQWLSAKGIEIRAYADEIGSVVRSSCLREVKYPYLLSELDEYRDTILRIPNEAIAQEMSAAIAEAQSLGDSLGGVVACCAFGVPVGLGEPIYDKLEARLAEAMLSINATRGFELGEGFDIARMRGSDANDAMYINQEGKVAFRSNHAGGSLGGISTGEVLQMRVAFKPTPSIGIEQETVSVDARSSVLGVRGRHDPCVVPRAIAVVEAMCALVLMDMMLLSDGISQ